MNGAAGYGSALSLLVLLVVVAVWLLWRRPRLASGRAARSSLRTVEATALGPRDRLLLVECEGRRYLLSQGVQGVRLLDRIDSPALSTRLAPGEVAS